MRRLILTIGVMVSLRMGEFTTASLVAAEGRPTVKPLQNIFHATLPYGGGNPKLEEKA